MLCDDLVGGDTVGHVLAGHGIAIGSREPESASPVRLVGELIRATLHHRDVGLVGGEGRETLREFVVAAGASLVRKPGLFGHAEADAEKHAAFGGSCFLSRSKTAKANGF